MSCHFEKMLLAAGARFFMLTTFRKNASGCSPGMVLLLEGGLAGESADMRAQNVLVSNVFLIV